MREFENSLYIIALFRTIYDIVKVKNSSGGFTITVYHGAILTINANDDVFQYLVEHRGCIVYVGDTLPKKYRRAHVVELGSRALIPPADTHQHFAPFSAFNAGLNVMEACFNAEILAMVDRFAAKCPSKTLIAFGASLYSVEERRHEAPLRLRSQQPRHSLLH